MKEYGNTFRSKHRAVRIACKTPLVLLSPLIAIVILAACAAIGAGVAIRDDAIPVIKDMAKAAAEGWLA